MDGDGGYYRCHERCGNRGIKKETLEQAVLDLLYEEFLTEANLLKIKMLIEKEHKNIAGLRNNQDKQLRKSLKEVEKEIEELVSLLPEVKHRRSLLDRMDQLEDQRIILTEKILNLKESEGQ